MRLGNAIGVAALISLLACSARADYVEMSRTFGSLGDGTTWVGGQVPFGSSTGLVTSAIGNVWTGNIWYDIAVRQTGGYVYGAGDGSLALRGGTAGSGVTTIYEIDDPRTDYGSYTNLFLSGALTFWSHYGENMEMNLLSGRVQVGALSLNALANGTLRIRNGLFHAQRMPSARMRVVFLEGGTGQLVVDRLEADIGNNLFIHFEPDSQGSLTIKERSAGGTMQSIFEWMIANNQVFIGDQPVTDLDRYVITADGTAATLSVVPRDVTLRLITVW